jgi:hypothetical protein
LQNSLPSIWSVAKIVGAFMDLSVASTTPVCLRSTVCSRRIPFRAASLQLSCTWSAYQDGSSTKGAAFPILLFVTFLHTERLAHTLASAVKYRGVLGSTVNSE